MKDYRRRRFLELLNGAPWKGDRAKFGAAAGLSNGRISQLLDPREPFGDNAAARLCLKLKLPPDYFDPPQLSSEERSARDLLTPAGVAMGAAFDRMSAEQQERFITELERAFGAKPQGRPRELGHSDIMDLDLDETDEQHRKRNKKPGDKSGTDT